MHKLINCNSCLYIQLYGDTPTCITILMLTKLIDMLGFSRTYVLLFLNINVQCESLIVISLVFFYQLKL